MGKACAQLFLEIVNSKNKEPKNKKIILDPILVQRESTTIV